MGWKFFTHYRAWMDDTELFIRQDTPNGPRSFVLPLKLQVVERGVLYETPTLSETRKECDDNLGDVTGFLQGALDAAWEMGLRPKGFADHANELTATRYHLEDMRALAFKTGKPEGGR